MDKKELVLDISRKINAASLEELEQIVIMQSDDNKINVKRQGIKIIYVVPKAYYNMLNEALDTEKQRRMNQDKKYDVETERAVKEIFSSSPRHTSRVSSNILDAKKSSTSDYLKKVEGKENRRKHNPNKKKREIKGAKKFNKSKKFVPKLIKMIVTVGLASALVFSAGSYAKKEISEYKQEASQKVLSVVKEDLGAEKIWSENTNPYPNTFNENYTITKDGEKYSYYAHRSNGEITVIKDEILDEDVIKAIQVVTSAQGGNVFDAIRANKLAKSIERGELDLSMDKAIEARAQEKDDDMVK